MSDYSDMVFVVRHWYGGNVGLALEQLTESRDRAKRRNDKYSEQLVKNLDRDIPLLEEIQKGNHGN